MHLISSEYLMWFERETIVNEMAFNRIFIGEEDGV